MNVLKWRRLSRMASFQNETNLLLVCFDEEEEVCGIKKDDISGFAASMLIVTVLEEIGNHRGDELPMIDQLHSR